METTFTALGQAFKDQVYAHLLDAGFDTDTAYSAAFEESIADVLLNDGVSKGDFEVEIDPISGVIV